MVRDFTVSALEEAGYRVIAASDGPSGLDLLEAHTEVALLFTDIVLTGPLNGRAVADAALRRRPDLKVLLTTGYTRDAGILGGRPGDDVEVITKPFTAAGADREGAGPARAAAEAANGRLIRTFIIARDKFDRHCEPPFGGVAIHRTAVRAARIAAIASLLAMKSSGPPRPRALG